MNNNRICIILPYFGTFNEYFNLFLESCKFNKTIDWYILTDDKNSYNYPGNVYVTYCAFSDIQKKAYKLLGDDIQIDTPYDLCKFRVIYHKLFPEIVDTYIYWGFCDCDLIWGDISTLILPALKENYGKIHWRGHFTLFKNIDTIRDLYSLKIPGNTTFEDCISKEKKNQYNLFDEVGINKIFDYCHIPIYKKLLIADLKIGVRNFYCNHFSEKEAYKNNKQIFEWNKGKLFRWYVHEDKLFREEFAYIHFLKRNMRNYLTNNFSEHYLIIPPDKIIDYVPISIDYINKVTKEGVYWRYYMQRFTPKVVFRKVKDALLSNKMLPDEYPYIIS